MAGPDRVTIEYAGDVALICIDNPPVNAASQAVRAGLLAALDTLEDDEDIQAVALYGAGRTFVAGADRAEFGQSPQPPYLPDLCDRIEASRLAVVAALHGAALGSGFELALAAHARVGLPGLRLGLPEVTLGTLPGAGGTQRLPRLAGLPFALDMVASGRAVPLAEALRHGLVDTCHDGTDPREAALTAARAAHRGILPTRRTGEIDVAPDPEALARERARLAAAAPHLLAPARAIDAVAASVLPLHEGMAQERALARECLASPQSAALVHAFLAERGAGRHRADPAPRPVEHVGLFGATPAGIALATAGLVAGHRVTLVDMDARALSIARDAVLSALGAASDAGTRTGPDPADRLRATPDRFALSAADIVIDATPEDGEAKPETANSLGRIAGAGAILAVVLEDGALGPLAKASRRPRDVVGLHLSAETKGRRTVETLAMEDTAPDTVATVAAWARRMGFVPIRAMADPGPLGPALRAETRSAAETLLVEGADMEQIDQAMEAFSYAKGPFARADHEGLDLGWAARSRGAAPAAPISDTFCEKGWFGRKSERGYYLYPPDAAPVPNDAIPDLLDRLRTARGVTARPFPAEEIVTRLTTAMIVDAVNLLESGRLSAAQDVDALFLLDQGFPRHRGGPLHLADTLGTEELITRIKTFAHAAPGDWRVPPLLLRLAATGERFGDLPRA